MMTTTMTADILFFYILPFLTLETILNMRQMNRWFYRTIPYKEMLRCVAKNNRFCNKHWFKEKKDGDNYNGQPSWVHNNAISRDMLDIYIRYEHVKPTSLLFWACANGFFDIVKVLVLCFNVNIHHQNDFALWQACFNQHTLIALFLHEHGANVNVSDIKRFLTIRNYHELYDRFYTLKS